MSPRCDTVEPQMNANTVGYADVRIFDTPGCRNSSRDCGRQYKNPNSNGCRPWVLPSIVGFHLRGNARGFLLDFSQLVEHVDTDR
jgi:hypothetical protein